MFGIDVTPCCASEDTLATREGHNNNDDALVGFLVRITITPDTISGSIDMAADIRVIGVSVTAVSRVAVSGPITRAVSRVAVAVTGPIKP